MSNNIKIILRWIAVLPMCILGSIIIYSLFYYAQSFYTDENSKYVIYFVPLSASFVSGWAFISSGVWTAPNYKKQTGLVLLVLVNLMMGYGIITQLISHNYIEFIKNIFSVIGSVVGFLMAGKEELLFES